jgi:beta-lactamase class D
MVRSLQPHSDIALITRRHALGLLAAVSLLPSRGLARVSSQRTEIRDGLARRFFDVGTVGTFVAYKTDDYLIIASDRDRSGTAQLPASTFKIPNSIIALETGVVADPDKDIFKWDGVKRSIEAWNKDHTLRSAISPRCRSIRRSPAASGRSGCRNMSICSNTATATSAAASTSSG